MAATVLRLTTDAVAALGHTRHQLLHQDVRGSQVDVDVLVEERVVGVGGRTELVDTGVVDQDVDRSRLGGQPAHVVGVGKISSDETCFAAGVLDLLHHLGAAFGAAPVNDDLSAELTELQCDCPTNPGGGASYQCGRAFKCRCHRTCSLAEILWMSCAIAQRHVYLIRPANEVICLANRRY